MKMRIGYVGLGKMGKNMVLRLLEQGIEVVAWNRSPKPREEVAASGAKAVETIAELVNTLEAPRIIWLMLPAGEVVDQILDELLSLLSKGDLVIDGGNSFYQDTLRRNEKLAEKGIHFLDIGVSGGPNGARNGASLMIGGSKEDFVRAEPLIKAIAAPKAYGHFGPVGTGHFAKMVHNGIEYGMMEAIAEGLAVLDKSQFQFNLPEVFRVYNNRTVIESRLTGWTEEALREDPRLGSYSSKVNHSGEGEWTIKTAKELGVEVPVIEKSFQVRLDSESEPDNIRNRAVSAMRGKFGGHSVKKP